MAAGKPLLEVALNGARSPAEHPGVPRTPQELAEASRTSIDAGANVVHLHVYDSIGVETLAPVPCAEVLRTVRALCPGVPISLTTSADIEPDPQRRLELVAGWIELPDLVTANQGEEGILELCAHLVARGVGIEAGLLSRADAEAFVGSGIADRCVRALVEPLDADPEEAVAHATEIERLLIDSGIRLQQIHHGDGVASWAVSARALQRGHGMRTGLEDTTVLPDGRSAADNADLVRVAMMMMTKRVASNG